MDPQSAGGFLSAILSVIVSRISMTMIQKDGDKTELVCIRRKACHIIYLARSLRVMAKINRQSYQYITRDTVESFSSNILKLSIMSRQHGIITTTARVNI